MAEHCRLKNYLKSSAFMFAGLTISANQPPQRLDVLLQPSQTVADICLKMFSGTLWGIVRELIVSAVVISVSLCYVIIGNTIAIST